MLLVQDVLRLTARALKLQFLPLRVVEEARDLVERCEVWWRRTHDLATAVDTGFWWALHELHWALVHGFCGGQWFSFPTRHPAPYGHRMCLSTPEARSIMVIPAQVLRLGYWAEADVVVRVLQAALRRWPCTVVDVGANVGTVSFLLAKAGARVVAVEPEETNALALVRGARQLAAEGWPNVSVLQAAAGSSPGFVRLKPYPGHLAGTSVDWGAPGDVWGDRLDSLLADAGPVCGLKIDTEGSDFRVLQGASQVLLNADAVIFEFAPKVLQSQGVPSPGALADQLPGYLLYHIFILSRRGEVPIQVGLRPVAAGDPVLAESWELFDRGRWAATGSGNILAARRLFLSRTRVLPWVTLRLMEASGPG